MDSETHFDNMDTSMEYMESAGFSHMEYLQDNTDYLNMDHLNFDTLDLIKSFAGDNTYLHLAPVSKDWNCVWGSSPKLTQGVDDYTSVTQLNLFLSTRAHPVRVASSVIVAAAGRVDLLGLMKGKVVPFNHRDICCAASSSERWEVLRWVMENGGLPVEDYTGNNDMDIRVEICLQLALAGQLEIFKLFEPDVNADSEDEGYLGDDDFDKYQLLYPNAASGGHLEFLKFASRIEFDLMDERIAAAASRNGHFELLKWAVSNGCGWDYTAMEGAIQFGSTEIIDWLVQNGCPQQ